MNHIFIKKMKQIDNNVILLGNELVYELQSNLRRSLKMRNIDKKVNGEIPFEMSLFCISHKLQLPVYYK